MPQKIAEGLFVNPIKKIHGLCSKVLRANNIQTTEQIEEQNRIKKLLESIVEVQSEIVNNGGNSHFEMLLASTLKDLRSQLKITINKDTDQLLQVFECNFQIIENKFQQQKEIIEENANKIIEKLTNEIRAKDEQLEKLEAQNKNLI